MEYEQFLKKERISFLDVSDKTEALRKLVDSIDFSEMNMEIDKAELLGKILKRETVMSTGIGLGIGMPHVRFKNIKEPIITIGISKDGVSNYESLDGSMVKLIILIIVGEGCHREYLMIMSEIVSLLKNNLTIGKIIESETIDGIYKIFVGEE